MKNADQETGATITLPNKCKKPEETSPDFAVSCRRGVGICLASDQCKRFSARMARVLII